MPRKLSKLEFVQKASVVHSQKYDYSKVEYVGSKEKVTIICPDHGDFQKIPNSHLLGQGCKKCSRTKMGIIRRDNLENFIEKARTVHGNKYDYSKSVYITSSEKIIIICSIHGEFQQAPNSHLNKRGCYNCSLIRNRESLTRSTKSFITEAIKLHGDKYDYSEVVYTGSQGNVKIGCKKHGFFFKKAYKHIANQGCPKCARNNLSGTSEFIEKSNYVHRDKYDYSKAKYVDSSSKVTIICSKHGSFEKSASDHIQGAGCPKDSKSRGHVAVRVKLQDLGIDFVEEWKNKDCKYIRPLPFDFFAPDCGLLIEFDGDQHRRPSLYYATSEEQAIENFRLTQKKDRIKTQWAQKAGYTLLRINSISEVETVLTNSIIEGLRNEILEASRKELLNNVNH